MQTENGTQTQPVNQPETAQAVQPVAAQAVNPNELSLWDICRIIFSCWKILLIVLLAAVVVGISVAFFRAYGKHYYGTNIEFYVTPIKSPDETQEEGSTAVYGAYNKSVMDNIIKLMSSESFAEGLIQKTEAEGGLPDSYKVEKTDENGEITAAYANLLLKVKNSIIFTYSVPQDSTGSFNSDIARSFIYVEIKVCGEENKQFAIDLLKSIKSQVPAFVEANMMVPTNYVGTKCTSITVLDAVRLTNPNYLQTSILKYSLVSCLAAGIIACAVIVIKKRPTYTR